MNSYEIQLITEDNRELTFIKMAENKSQAIQNIAREMDLWNIKTINIKEFN